MVSKEIARFKAGESRQRLGVRTKTTTSKKILVRTSKGDFYVTRSELEAIKQGAKVTQEKVTVLEAEGKPVAQISEGVKEKIEAESRVQQELSLFPTALHPRLRSLAEQAAEGKPSARFGLRVVEAPFAIVEEFAEGGRKLKSAIRGEKPTKEEQVQHFLKGTGIFGESLVIGTHLAHGFRTDPYGTAGSVVGQAAVFATAAGAIRVGGRVISRARFGRAADVVVEEGVVAGRGTRVKTGEKVTEIVPEYESVVRVGRRTYRIRGTAITEFEPVRLGTGVVGKARFAVTPVEGGLTSIFRQRTTGVVKTVTGVAGTEVIPPQYPKPTKPTALVTALKVEPITTTTTKITAATVDYPSLKPTSFSESLISEAGTRVGFVTKIGEPSAFVPEPSRVRGEITTGITKQVTTTTFQVGLQTGVTESAVAKFKIEKAAFVQKFEVSPAAPAVAVTRVKPTTVTQFRLATFEETRVKPLLETKVGIRTETRAKPLTLERVRGRIAERETVREAIVTREAVQTRQLQKTKVQTIQVAEPRVISQRLVPPILPSGLGVPIAPFISKGLRFFERRAKRVKSEPKRAFQPTATALSFGLKGAGTAFGTISGFGIRPVKKKKRR